MARTRPIRSCLTAVATSSSFLLTGIGPVTAQATWNLLTPAASPPARWQHAMSYDLLRDRVVVFGGRNAASFTLGDTWEFDGGTWTQVTPTNSPSPRNLSTMVFDFARGQSVLFGGSTGNGETWLWDGVDWTLAQPTTSPAPRRLGAMAYDSDRAVVVMFGGVLSFSNGLFADTWEWDGTDWTLIPTTNAPSPRVTQMTYDASRRRMVIHGGESGNNVYEGDTWEFDGVDWTQVNTPTSPGIRTAQTMQYDHRRQRVVLFGGFDQSFTNLGDTWEFDGSDWTQVTPSAAPTPRRSFDNSVYWWNQDRILMFGGFTNTGEVAETWTLDGATNGLFSVLGSGCSTASNAPGLSGTTPTLGLTFDLTVGGLGAAGGALVAFGLSDQGYLGLPLPIDLGIIGLPACDLRAAPELLVLSLATGGAATIPWAIQNQPSLLLQTFFAQGIAFDLAAGLQFTGTTALGRGVIGN